MDRPRLPPGCRARSLARGVDQLAVLRQLLQQGLLGDLQLGPALPAQRLLDGLHRRGDGDLEHAVAAAAGPRRVVPRGPRGRTGRSAAGSVSISRVDAAGPADDPDLAVPQQRPERLQEDLARLLLLDRPSISSRMATRSSRGTHATSCSHPGHGVAEVRGELLEGGRQQGEVAGDPRVVLLAGDAR